jgi:hypothetical protein
MWTDQRQDGVWNWPKCNGPPFKKDDHHGAVFAAVGVSLAPFQSWQKFPEAALSQHKRREIIPRHSFGGAREGGNWSGDGG